MHDYSHKSAILSILRQVIYDILYLFQKSTWISQKAHEELNVLLPFNPNVKVQHTQREQLAVAKLEVTKSQILSRSKIISLQDTFMRVLHIESSHLVQTNNRVLVSKGVIMAVRRWGSCDIIAMSQAILSISV
ncbi:gag-pol polyprotein [Gossypium australe]|uniref:Gag-pol polyprotein n=1 Tax=Gossypium australe TaxID=47621 RepID=A0A5B6WNK7_9ROSI|nr:gag-pol polyprotein [Gossypium australe]